MINSAKLARSSVVSLILITVVLFASTTIAQSGFFRDGSVFLNRRSCDKPQVRQLAVELDDFVEDVDFLLRRVDSIGESMVCPARPSMGKTILYSVKKPDAFKLDKLDLTISLPDESLLEGTSACTSQGTQGAGVLCLYAKGNHGGSLSLVAETGYKYHTVMRQPRPKDARHTPEEVALLKASEIGDCLSAKEILAKGADTEVANGWGTPLQIASMKGHVRVVRLLLEGGANIEAAGGAFEITPLGQAAMNGDIDVMKLLLKYGANLIWTTERHQSPLSLAASGGYRCGEDGYYRIKKEAFDLLINAGATIPDYPYSLLHSAAYMGNVYLVKALLEKGFSPRHLDESGRTALHAAIAGCGDEKTILLLCREGAELEARDKAGNTPLLLIKNNFFQGKAELARTLSLLVGLGAKIDAQDANGITLLHAAVIRRHELFVKLLLQYGAHATILNNAGKTPLDLALNPPALGNERFSQITESEDGQMITTRVDEERYLAFKDGNMKNIQALLHDAAKK